MAYCGPLRCIKRHAHSPSLPLFRLFLPQGCDDIQVTFLQWMYFSSASAILPLFFFVSSPFMTTPSGLWVSLQKKSKRSSPPYKGFSFFLTMTQLFFRAGSEGASSLRIIGSRAPNRLPFWISTSLPRTSVSQTFFLFPKDRERFPRRFLFYAPAGVIDLNPLPSLANDCLDAPELVVDGLAPPSSSFSPSPFLVRLSLFPKRPRHPAAEPRFPSFLPP